MHKFKKDTVFLCLAIAVIFIALLVALPSTPDLSGRAQLTPVIDGWYYMDNGVKTPVELPATIHYSGDDALTLYNDGLTQAAAGKTLTTVGVENGLLVSMNGEVLYEYADDYFPRNSQMKSKYECDIPIPAGAEVGVLEISYEKVSSGNYSLSQFYIGDGGAVMWRHITDNAVTIILAFVFFLLSVLAVGIAIYLHFSRIEKKRFVDTAAFLFICGVWVFTDTSLTQTQSGNAALVCTISFYAFMLLAVPMLYFVKHTSGMENYHVLDWLIRLFYLNALLQGIIHQFMHVEFRNMLFVTHLLLTAGVGISVVLMVSAYRKNKNRDLTMVLTAFALLGFSGVLAMALYWLFNIPFYGTIFGVGICLFVLILIQNIIMIMAENINYRTEMQVYQRLLREDGMTGMESRRPFDDYLAVIKKNPVKYKDAALISFKVNNLKRTNEEFGHSAGDELILGAAKCISETFGNDGRCYRLDRDEFCVLLENTQVGKEEWLHRFDLAIQKFNRNSRYRLSVARGWSDFCNEDGSLKSISDWEYNASKNLR